MPRYSLTAPATDGPLRGPRWALWLVKVATGALLTAPAWWLAGPGVALAVTLAGYLGSKAVRLDWRGHRLVGARVNGITASAPDLVFDGILHLLPWCGAASVPWWAWAALGLTALLTYPYARP